MIAQFLLFAAIGTSTPGQCILLPEWVYPTNGVPTLLGENIPGLQTNRFLRIDRSAALSYFAAIDGYYERKMRPLTAEQFYVGEIIGTTNRFWPGGAISTNFLADAAADANRVFTNYWRRVDVNLKHKVLYLAEEWKKTPADRPKALYYGSSSFGKECHDWIAYNDLSLSNAVELGLSWATNGLWLGIDDALWFGETNSINVGYNSPLVINSAVLRHAHLPDPTLASNRTETSWAQLAARAGGRFFESDVYATNWTWRITGDDIAFAAEVQAVVDKTYHSSADGYGFRPDRVERSCGGGCTVVFTCDDASVEDIVPLYDANSNFTAQAEVILSIGGLTRRNEVWNEEVVSNRYPYAYFETGNEYTFGAGVDFGVLGGGGPVTFEAFASIGNPEAAIEVFSQLEEDVRYPVSFISDANGVELYIYDENKGLSYSKYIWYRDPYTKIPDVLPAEYYELKEFLLRIRCDSDCTLWRSEDTGLTLDIEHSDDVNRRGDIPFLVPHRSQLGNVSSVSVQWLLKKERMWESVYNGDEVEYYSAGGFNISAPHGGFTPANYNSLVGGQMRYILNQKLEDAKSEVLARSGAGSFENPLASLSGHFNNIANSWRSRLDGKKFVFGVQNGFIDGVEVIVHNGDPTFVYAGTNVELPRDPVSGTVANFSSKLGIAMEVDEGDNPYEILITPSINPIIYWKFSNLPCSD